MNLICKPSRIQVSKLETMGFIGKKYRDGGGGLIVLWSKAQILAHLGQGTATETEPL